MGSKMDSFVMVIITLCLLVIRYNTCEAIESCASLDCDHVCSLSGNVAKCSCNSGFALESDGVTCSDIDECDLDIDDCEHICANTEGGFQCSCQEGFYLQDDNRTCSRMLCDDTWTEWFDESNTSIGELELVDSLRTTHEFCSNPTDIECRLAAPPHTPYEQTGQIATCLLPSGFVCFHDDQRGQCNDYAVRVLCPANCTEESSAASMTTTASLISTASLTTTSLSLLIETTQYDEETTFSAPFSQDSMHVSLPSGRTSREQTTLSPLSTTETLSVSTIIAYLVTILGTTSDYTPATVVSATNPRSSPLSYSRNEDITTTTMADVLGITSTHTNAPIVSVADEIKSKTPPLFSPAVSLQAEHSITTEIMLTHTSVAQKTDARQQTIATTVVESVRESTVYTTGLCKKPAPHHCEGNINGRRFQLTFSVEGIEWSSDLTNSESCDFHNLAADVSASLQLTFESTNLSGTFLCFYINSFRLTLRRRRDVSNSTVELESELPILDIYTWVTEHVISDAFIEGVISTNAFRRYSMSVIIGTEVVVELDPIAGQGEVAVPTMSETATGILMVVGIALGTILIITIAWLTSKAWKRYSSKKQRGYERTYLTDFEDQGLQLDWNVGNPQETPCRNTNSPSYDSYPGHDSKMSVKSRDRPWSYIYGYSDDNRNEQHVRVTLEPMQRPSKYERFLENNGIKMQLQKTSSVDNYMPKVQQVVSSSLATHPRDLNGGTTDVIV
uniref:Uncharacterized protein LOC100369700 n=1 Tax=Saccoglossus kowalevskii TaxID=10224 RepID=A0ABM0LUY6_SACKO|nr:PREDICTED: uncharacterized protein LOC100369700 [Saccoglossus kowalevskii]